MAEGTGILPGLSPVGGKPVHAAFDSGHLTSDAGVLLLAEVDRRLGVSARLVRCIEDLRDPERIRHGIAEMIRFRALLIAAAYRMRRSLRALAPKASFWRDARFDTIRVALIKVAARVTEMVTRIKVSPPSSFPCRTSMALLAERAAKIPP